MPDANLNQAVDGIIGAGYGSAGERCMAVSVAVAVGNVADELVKKIKELKGKPHLNQEKNQIDTIKDLNKQYEKLLVISILDDKEKNIIKDILVNKTKVRFQKIHELPFKDLRSLVDKGKKEINNGIIIVYAIKDEKIGLAIGITQELSKKINAVDLVKIGSEIIGGKGGGGRADFAQAGGSLIEKISSTSATFSTNNF
jgi:alanyl-tRNA synthetase